MGKTGDRIRTMNSCSFLCLEPIYIRSFRTKYRKLTKSTEISVLCMRVKVAVTKRALINSLMLLNLTRYRRMKYPIKTNLALTAN
jgi:hypothetical protein